MSDCVLVVTVGNTDLQVLIRKEGKLFRGEMGNVRAFHQGLLDGTIPYVLDGTWAVGRKAPQLPRCSQPVEPDLGGALLEKGQIYELERTEGRLILVPAKLAEVVASLKVHPSYQPVAAVVFGTCRDDPGTIGINAYRDEPIAAAPLISRWIADELGLTPAEADGQIGAGIAGWMNILDGGMNASGTGRDYPVNRQAMSRIDHTLRTMASIDHSLVACLSLGGGIPSFKEQIAAAAQFHFERRVLDWRSVQIGAGPDWTEIDALPPSPAESFRTRLFARDAVRRGAFLDALAIAAHLRNDPGEKPWVSTLFEAAKYLSGRKPGADAPPFVLALLDPGLPHALTASFRVESALSIRRIQDAVIDTYAFYETALNDAINRLLPEGCRIEGVLNGILCPGDFDLAAYFPTLPPGSVERVERRDRPSVEGLWSYQLEFDRRTNASVLNHWLDLMSSDLRSALSDLHEALTKPAWDREILGLLGVGAIQGVDSISAKRLRNLRAHHYMTAGETEAARILFTGRGVWNSTLSGPPGIHFLACPLINNVLKALGVSDPVARYEGLIDGLLEVLENHEI